MRIGRTLVALLRAAAVGRAADSQPVLRTLDGKSTPCEVLELTATQVVVKADGQRRPTPTCQMMPTAAYLSAAIVIQSSGVAANPRLASVRPVTHHVTTGPSRRLRRLAHAGIHDRGQPSAQLTGDEEEPWTGTD